MATYFGKYADFDTVSKSEAGELLGANNAVGDVYNIELEMEDGSYRAWLVNQFGSRIGFFDTEVSRKLSITAADGLVCKAVLSFVAFTNHPGEGHYWGSAAIVCYNPAYEKEFTKFIASLSDKIGDDVRPRIDFDKEAVQRIIDTDGEWMPTQTTLLPSDVKGMAIIKRRRRLVDKLTSQGRARNKGCYVASWVFLLLIVALIVFGLKSCFGW